MTEPNPHALTGAYALDALDDNEAASFRAHLLECDSCPSEVAELRVTAVRLFDTVTENPPADLRARVLTAVDRTAQLSPLPISLAERRGSRRRRIMAVTGGALAAAAVAAGALFVVNADNPPTAADVLAAADARVIPLHDPTPDEPRAEVVLSLSEDAAVLRMDALPPAPPGRTYQAWIFQGGDNPVPSATFEPTGTGDVAAVLVNAADARRFAVTIEPDGGSTSPSGLPLMEFDVADA